MYFIYGGPKNIQKILLQIAVHYHQQMVIIHLSQTITDTFSNQTKTKTIWYGWAHVERLVASKFNPFVQKNNHKVGIADIYPSGTVRY